MTHNITRQVALIEIDGIVVALKLSATAWTQILEIAAREGSGQLVVGEVPNQSILDDLSSALVIR